MITGKLQKHGDTFVVTVSHEEVERLGLAEGQEVVFGVRALEAGSALTDDVRDAFDTEFDREKEGLRYLADH